MSKVFASSRATARWPGAMLSVLMGFLAIDCAYAIDPTAAARGLRAMHGALSAQLHDNQFGRAVHLESRDTTRALKGEVYVALDYPFATVSEALSGPENWCDILTLHINVKYCHASDAAAGTVLTVDLGKKYDQPLADAFRIAFSYAKRAATPDYFAIELVADFGPLNTRDYHIELEAIPIDDGRTFLHFTYAYAFGVGGRLAMHGYLATVARDKHGFTVSGQTSDGAPDYIQGIRGVIERNTMRYYLAIDAYLASMSVAPTLRFEQRLRYWFDSTERYAFQLHEMDRDQYVAMKHRELARQMVTP